MKFFNIAKLSEKKFSQIEVELTDVKTLGQVLSWANTKPKTNFIPQIVAETIQQDEYTHDVVIPFLDYFLVFDTT